MGLTPAIDQLLRREMTQAAVHHVGVTGKHQPGSPVERHEVVPGRVAAPQTEVLQVAAAARQALGVLNLQGVPTLEPAQRVAGRHGAPRGRLGAVNTVYDVTDRHLQEVREGRGNCNDCGFQF